MFQKSPIPRALPDGTLKELVECDLCLGFWVYLFLGAIYKINIDEKLDENKLISRLATGSFATFVMHLLSIGWREKFSTYIVE
jgi:hypothetical protein